MLAAGNLPDYDHWTLQELRDASNLLTQPQTAFKGVGFRGPKANLTYQQSLQLYAINLALLAKEVRWTGTQPRSGEQSSTEDFPDLQDFHNRLAHQFPRYIAPGERVHFMLYRPRYVGEPVQKGRFEERTDAVSIHRIGNVFEVEELPVYLTAEQEKWNPSVLEVRDELNDSGLLERKARHEWTRLDGPYLWYRQDELVGSVIYRCEVRVVAGGIRIEADRHIAPRGEVKRVARDPMYDPARVTAFRPGRDIPFHPLAADWPHLASVQWFNQRAAELAGTFYAARLSELLSQEAEEAKQAPAGVLMNSELSSEFGRSTPTSLSQARWFKDRQ